MSDLKKKPLPRKNPGGDPLDVGSAVSFILNQTVLTVDASLDKSYPELVGTMKTVDFTLKSVSTLQKDLGAQRRRLSKQATTLRQLQPVTKPAEGDIRSGINGKTFIFLAGAWGDYIKPDHIVEK